MKTVFVDIDTQFDFLAPAGALYVPGAEKLIPALGELNRRAAATGVPVLSTMDAHSEEDPEFRQWRPHCVAGTLGQAKAPETLLDRRVVIPTEPGDYPIAGAEQIVIEKQQLDLFTNPNLPAVLDRLGAERYVVYGVVTEFCVRCAAFGLLRLGKRVEVVADAIQTLNPEEGEKTLREFQDAGGALATISSV